MRPLLKTANSHSFLLCATSWSSYKKMYNTLLAPKKIGREEKFLHVFKEREECEPERTHPLLPLYVSHDSDTVTRVTLISNSPRALLPSKAWILYWVDSSLFKPQGLCTCCSLLRGLLVMAGASSSFMARATMSPPPRGLLWWLLLKQPTHSTSHPILFPSSVSLLHVSLSIIISLLVWSYALSPPLKCTLRV